MNTSAPARLGALVLAATLGLAGCSATTSSAPQGASASPAASAAAAVEIQDAWVKAADSGMSAAFGELRNTGADEAVLVAVTSPASTEIQLHETVDDGSGAMVMREKGGGFAVPAGGSLALEPGGNHIMLMDLTAPLRAGDEVELVLVFADGSERTVTAPVKDYSGADENYVGDDADMDMGH